MREIERVKMEIKKNKLPIKSDVISFIGKVKFSVPRTVFKIIDGETYTRFTEDEIILKTNEQNEIIPLFDYEYFFKPLSYVLYINDLLFDNNSYSNLIAKYSTNTMVNRIIVAYNQNILPKIIKRLFTSKKDLVFNEYNSSWQENENHKLFNKCLRNNEIYVLMMDYGYNNCLYYSFSFESLIDIPYSLIPENLLSYLIRNKIFEKEYNQIQNTINLLTYKTKHYATSKQ